MVAEGAGANLRAAPSLGAAILVRLLKDAVVEELAGQGQAGSAGWRRVRWNNREGWIAEGLLRPAGPVPLQQVARGDQGIDFERPLAPGAYPLVQLSTGRPLAQLGEPVYVDEAGVPVPATRRAPAPAPPVMVPTATP
jgi:hypothetical protein